MIVINFAHPLTEEHLKAVERLTAEPVDRVIEASARFDPQSSFVEQARALVDSVGLTPVEWQTLPIVVNPPSLSVIAALALAEAHGRMGCFPAVIRLREVVGAVARRFEVAEVLDLNAVRHAARNLR